MFVHPTFWLCFYACFLFIYFYSKTALRKFSSLLHVGLQCVRYLTEFSYFCERHLTEFPVGAR